jgi:hypothetical protein
MVLLPYFAYAVYLLNCSINEYVLFPQFQLQDTETTSGESEVKFQVSRDTLGAMLRSMAYIREQLSNPVSILYLLLWGNILFGQWIKKVVF